MQQCGHAAADRQTHKQTRVTNIHFASPTTHAKCNKTKNNSSKAIVDNRLHPQCCPLVSDFEYTPYLRPFAWQIMGKHDVIQKVGCT